MEWWSYLVRIWSKLYYWGPSGPKPSCLYRPPCTTMIEWLRLGTFFASFYLLACLWWNGYLKTGFLDGGTGTWKPGFWSPGFWVPTVPWRNGFKASWRWLFFIFCHTYLMIFQCCAATSECSTSKNHQIWKKLKKPCSIFPKPIPSADFGYPFLRYCLLDRLLFLLGW